jgi:saccharopine dehydrogenase-like NADP-dependent oxidoreductase
MQHILILGIGRSTYYLLQYLNDFIASGEIVIKAMDAQLELVEKRTKEFSNISFVQSEITATSLEGEIAQADIVVSMLPPTFHAMVATLCLNEGKHFFTASYVSAEIKAMHEQALNKGLLFMMECGLDPGIDHMSALSLIHTIKEQGANITSFESFTGGLVHPSYTNPPWNYKVSWNPRNVVLAGQGADAQYKQDGVNKVVSYTELFAHPSTWSISTTDVYEGYPNRDSLSYQSLYDLTDATTFVRGTLRYPGFCKGWNNIIQLGLTNDVIQIKEDAFRTGKSFLSQLLPEGTKTLQEKIIQACGTKEVLPYVEALGLLEDAPIATMAGTAAQIFQTIIEKKWRLEKSDKDRIVMIHRLGYEVNGEKKQVQSSLIVDGEDAERTAMAKTVGLPLAIAIDLFLHGKIKKRGVVIPIHTEIYTPILERLKSFGVVFKEKVG